MSYFEAVKHGRFPFNGEREVMTGAAILGQTQSSRKN